MTRYIDADKIKASIMQFVQDLGVFGKSAVKMCIDTIDNASAADVAPVKRGKWMETEWTGTCGGDFYERLCSYCKEYAYIDVDDKFDYCPYCGAKMEGVTE